MASEPVTQEQRAVIDAIADAPGDKSVVGDAITALRAALTAVTAERDAANLAVDGLLRQLEERAAERDALLEAVLAIRPTSAGHDCPWCEEWDGDTHGEDCILATIEEAARAK